MSKRRKGTYETIKEYISSIDEVENINDIYRWQRELLDCKCEFCKTVAVYETCDSSHPGINELDSQNRSINERDARNRGINGRNSQNRGINEHDSQNRGINEHDSQNRGINEHDSQNRDINKRDSQNRGINELDSQNLGSRSPRQNQSSSKDGKDRSSSVSPERSDKENEYANSSPKSVTLFETNNSISTCKKIFTASDGEKSPSSSLELFKVTVYRKLPLIESTAELDRSVDDFEKILLLRREGEGTKPIFDRAEIQEANMKGLIPDGEDQSREEEAMITIFDYAEIQEAIKKSLMTAGEDQSREGEGTVPIFDSAEIQEAIKKSLIPDGQDQSAYFRPASHPSCSWSASYTSQRRYSH